MLTPAQRSLVARTAVLTSWSQTPDRTARTTNARAAGPGSHAYWLARLDPERFADATDAAKLAAAEALRRAHYTRLALASSKARARKAGR